MAEATTSNQNNPTEFIHEVNDIRDRVSSLTDSLCDLTESYKRWLLVGIGLHSVLSPALRKFVKPKLDELWQKLNSSHGLSSQSHPNQMKCYLKTFFNYEAINGNKVHGLRQQEKFNYKVTNSVDFSKLFFLQTNMAQYTDFDESCDLSALLGIIINTGICSVSAIQYAIQFRDNVRNPWAHCNHTQWDHTKYRDSLELMEKLAQSLGLSNEEEQQLMSDLQKWRQKGTEFINGKANVIAEVTRQVQNLIRYAESIFVDNPEMMQKLKDQLVKAENILFNHEQRIQQLEQTVMKHEKEQQTFVKRKPGLMEAKLKHWKEENKTFVATEAVTSILKCVQENKCVTITGNSGMGKTAMMRHIVLQMADKGYDIVPIIEPRDVEQFYSPEHKTIFMVDDFCGTFSANKKEVDKWKTFIDQSYTYLSDNVKFIVACRLQVFNDSLFKTLSVFKSNVCNLLSKEFKLLNVDLQSIAKLYLKTEAKKVAEYVDMYDCFPLLCKLYKNNPSLQITNFFQNPFSVYETEIDDMLSAGHDRKYCALMLCVVFNNSLEEALLTDSIDEDTRNIFRNVFETCRLNRETSRIILLDELDTLLNSYLQKEEGCYKTVHDKMFDFLSYYFGKKITTCKCLIQNARSRFIAERFSLIIKKPNNEFIIHLETSLHNMYMERLVHDWQNGDVYDVFSNTNMKYEAFRQMFLTKVKNYDQESQQKMADTCDKRLGSTVLIMCFYNDMHWLSWCLNHQVDVNKCDTMYGESPLFIACGKGHTETVTALLNKGADINICRTDNGASPLFIACQEGHTETVAALLNKGTDINKCKTDTGASPLYTACQQGHTETVTALLNKGADINKCRTDNGASPLFIACAQGHTETVTALLNKGADINKCMIDTGASPLYIACQNGQTETVTALLKKGADINKGRTDARASPLYIACEKGHTETVTALLNKGADINKCTTDNGASPLHVACYFGHIDIVELLLHHRADHYITLTDGRLPVDLAKERKHDNIVIKLESLHK